MSTRRKPVVGETLLRKTSSRYKKDTAETLSVRVTHVGRKYFTVVPCDGARAWCESVHLLENWCEKTSTNYASTLYESEQEIRDQDEMVSIRDNLRKQFGGWGALPDLTLNQLRRIKGILEEGRQ